MTRLLLTGFEPFHNSSLNPSKALVERFEHPSLVAKSILPVVFDESARKLVELIDLHAPDVVISLGQAEGRREITPERVAINLDDARIEDNSGNAPSESPIIPGAPDAYFSTLPIQRLVAAMRKVDVPAAISLSAGTFVCNHVFYQMQNYYAGKPIRSGFVHLPIMNEQSSEFPGLPTLSIEVMERGIRALVEAL